MTPRPYDRCLGCGHTPHAAGKCPTVAAFTGAACACTTDILTSHPSEAAAPDAPAPLVPGAAPRIRLIPVLSGRERAYGARHPETALGKWGREQ